jgi:hypothetical protein
MDSPSECIVTLLRLYATILRIKASISMILGRRNAYRNLIMDNAYV